MLKKDPVLHQRDLPSGHLFIICDLSPSAILNVRCTVSSFTGMYGEKPSIPKWWQHSSHFHLQCWWWDDRGQLFTAADSTMTQRNAVWTQRSPLLQLHHICPTLMNLHQILKPFRLYWSWAKTLWTTGRWWTQQQQDSPTFSANFITRYPVFLLLYLYKIRNC